MNLDIFDLTEKQIFHSNHHTLPKWIRGTYSIKRSGIPKKSKSSCSLVNKFKEQEYHKLLDTHCYRCGRKLVVSNTTLCDSCDLELTNQVESNKVKDKLFYSVYFKEVDKK